MLHRNIHIYNLFDSYFFIYLNLYYEIIIKVTQKNNSIKVFRGFQFTSKTNLYNTIGNLINKLYQTYTLKIVPFLQCRQISCFQIKCYPANGLSLLIWENSLD